MRYFFILIILFGLWTSWKNIEHKQYLRAYSIFSIALPFVCFSTAVCYNRFFAFERLPFVVFNLLLALVYLTHLVIVSESAFQSKSQMKIIQKFASVVSLFRTQLAIRIPYQEEKRDLVLRILILALIEMSVKLLELNYRYFYFIVYPTIVIHLRLVGVLFFMYLLQTRLKLINRELSDIQSIEFASSNVQSNCMHKSKPVVISDNVFTRPSTYNRLLSLKRIYGELFEICEHIGAIFGWSLLIVVIQIFALSTFQTYWAYIHLSNIKRFITDLMSIVPSLIVLGSLTFHCSSYLQEVGVTYFYPEDKILI